RTDEPEHPSTLSDQLINTSRTPGEAHTVKAYAHDLKDWFVYLAGLGLDWRSVVAGAADRAASGCRSRSRSAASPPRTTPQKPSE
ncbi:hypothetical protein, partial [Streptomyces sp. YGL11-2]|uniref:hypothetical protein n=1 Tax=Streptomyces sp. YGL11-2 TaxID=3414028 RepID=UPI003CF55EB5